MVIYDKDIDKSELPSTATANNFVDIAQILGKYQLAEEIIDSDRCDLLKAFTVTSGSLRSHDPDWRPEITKNLVDQPAPDDGSDHDDHTPHKRQRMSTTQYRQGFSKSWLTKFDWLSYNSVDNSIVCRLCRQQRCEGVWVSGTRRPDGPPRNELEEEIVSKVLKSMRMLLMVCQHV